LIGVRSLWLNLFNNIRFINLAAKILRVCWRSKYEFSRKAKCDQNHIPVIVNLGRLKKTRDLFNIWASGYSPSGPISSQLSKVKGKSTYMFSSECMRISAFCSPACWLYLLKPGGERKSAYVWRKMYTLFYPDPQR